MRLLELSLQSSHSHFLLGSMPRNYPIQCRNYGNMVSFSRNSALYIDDCSLYHLIEIGKRDTALNADLYGYCNAEGEELSCRALFGTICCGN